MPENANRPEPSESIAATHKVRASQGDAGIRLDRFLADRLPDLSRSRLSQLIRDGQVAAVVGADRRTVSDPSYRVKPADAFEILVPPATPAVPEAQAMDLAILFEDRDLIVIDKPPGLVVHPAPGNPDKTLVNALIAHCGAGLLGIGGVARPGIVHRLDKDTSGVMVAAKTERAHAGLSALFAAHDIDRAYRAIVWGVPKPRDGVVDAPLGRHPTNRKKMAIVRRDGKRALTRYKTMKSQDALASLVECRLETGRTHQIRVHLASCGSPVVGDSLYGGRRRAPKSAPEAMREALDSFPRQALHACRLGFVHPVTGEKLVFSTDLPGDMSALANILELI